MQKGIAIAGSLIVDYVKYINSYPAPQALTTISAMDRSVGGLACNCGLALAKLDPSLPVKIIGIVGHDEAGEYIMSQFMEHKNIDVTHVLRQGSTSYTDVMSELGTGRRTFFTYNGANSLLAPEHFDFISIGADILHIGYILLLDALDAPDPDYPTAMCRVLDAAQKAGILTSVDVVSEEGERFRELVPPALKYVDFCCINEYEASRTTGIPLRGAGGEVLVENLPEACRMLMDIGVRRWVVLHMPEMACGLVRGGEYVQTPSWKIPDGFIKSSVGAGDAFASAVLYGAYHGWPLERAIHVAGAVAACSLSGAGASDAIKPLPELLDEMGRLQ
ncbi:MAG: carbohydrate kinase family protein [Oscillospiraceae bacterium]|nr:carbohydrate kinase family protein [Oscillospiraceae bacterium]